LSIEIDVRSLRRFWNLRSGHLMFIVKVDFGAEQPELDDLVEASDEIRYRLSTQGDENAADAQQWLLLKQGWSGVLTGATTVDAALEWFELFIAPGGTRSTARSSVGRAAPCSPNATRILN
jgi:hypothetical protein